jgi:hypothetical protein
LFLRPDFLKGIFMNNDQRPPLRRTLESKRRAFPWRLGLLLLFLFSGLGGSGSAAVRDEEISNSFVRLSIQDGLSQGSGLSIIQDRRGFIWIGTEDGLNRYDGYRFRVYRPSEDPSSLSNNSANVLFEDSQGVLWVGTNSGLNRYNRDLDNFTRFFNNPRDPLSLSHNAVYSISEDRAGDTSAGRRISRLLIAGEFGRSSRTGPGFYGWRRSGDCTLSSRKPVK